MKAIIIQDSDARDLLTQLELAKYKPMIFASNFGGLSDTEKEILLEDVHHHFHFYVTRWLQEQGAQITR